MYTGDLSNVMELLFFAHVDNTLHQEDVSSGLTLPLLLILGYTNGFHVWTIPVSQLRYMYNFEFIIFLSGSVREAYVYMQGAKKIIFTACHSGKLKLAFTIPDVISTSPKNFLISRIDLTVLLLF